MAILKVIEVMSNSDKSWEDATMNGINKASETVKNIKSAWVKDQSVHIQEDGKVEYRVGLKISFYVK